MFKSLFIFLLILIVASCTTTVVKKETPQPAESVPVVNNWFEGYTITDNTNIREDASLRADVVTNLDDGIKVQVLENKNGWYKVITPDNQEGWIRSDFVGTADLSYAKKAADFVDSTLKKYDTELFIDENDPYKIIYMILPEMYYRDKNHARRYADEIGHLYQDQVFPGEVQIRILNKDKETLYTRSILPKKGATFLKAPYMKYGRVYSTSLKNTELTIRTLIPVSLDEDQLAEMAYEISSRYGDQISKIEVYFVEDNDEGLKVYTRKDYTPSDPKVCRLYYLEDKQGPLFKENFCSKK